MNSPNILAVEEAKPGTALITVQLTIGGNTTSITARLDWPHGKTALDMFAELSLFMGRSDERGRAEIFESMQRVEI